jgi:hypothetical protein
MELTADTLAVCILCARIVTGPHACAYAPPSTFLERLIFQLRRMQISSMRMKAKRHERRR